MNASNKFKTKTERIEELERDLNQCRDAHKRQQQNYISLHDSVIGEGCFVGDLDAIEIARKQREELEFLRPRVRRLTEANSGMADELAKLNELEKLKFK